jgi:hypothetical protein
MGVPALPNITGGAATSGDVRSDVGVGFGPVNIGGLFGSGASSDANKFLIPALIAGGVLLAFLFFKRK